MTFPGGITEEMTPDEAFAFTLAFLDTSPDDDTLRTAALTIGEPVIDWHWQILEGRLVTLATERADCPQPEVGPGYPGGLDAPAPTALVNGRPHRTDF